MLKVAVIAERRYLGQRMPGAVVQALQARGVPVDVICPDGSRFFPETGLVQTPDAGWTFDLNSYDVLVSRNRNGLGLAMLSYAEAAGSLCINAYAAAERIRNKAHLAVVLNRAGIPCAPTVLARDAASLAGLPRSHFPLILKPVFAARKPSPFNTDPAATPQLVTPTPAMITLGRRCGQVFGLEIYGVDTIQTRDGLMVIEVNEFPNFTSIPGAGEWIAKFVLRRALGDMQPKRGLYGTTADRVLASALSA